MIIRGSDVDMLSKYFSPIQTWNRQLLQFYIHMNWRFAPLVFEQTETGFICLLPLNKSYIDIKSCVLMSNRHDARAFLHAYFNAHANYTLLSYISTERSYGF